MSSANYEDIDSVTDRYKAAVDDDLQQEPPIAGTKTLMTTEEDGLMMGTSAQKSTINGEDDESNNSEDALAEEYDMSLEELIYSSSSYYAIAKPVVLTMVLAALAVCFINDDITRQEGQQAMASAYQYFDVNDGSQSAGENLALSLANALIMVTFICCMTFVIVFLYRLKFMKCLVGYMILCSGALLGILGGNVLQKAITVYRIPVDKPSFYLFVFNFCIVGVLAVFFGRGIPKYITQAYLIATSVILAWHLSFFDDWTTWSLLFMLAIYDLCAVLTPCGPLKALVNAMSQEDSPEMPGLLFEAELPPEAKRPGVPRAQTTVSDSARSKQQVGDTVSASPSADSQNSTATSSEPTVKIPLAIAKVYQLPIVSVPSQSMSVMFPQHKSSGVEAPLLLEDDSSVILPDNPTAEQLQAIVVARLPATGGRLEHVQRRGKKVYLERDRHGNPKRILWVDRNGKVFAEMREDDEEGPEQNSIRLGLGDFIFYSVLVSKAAQYSFATFAACLLVILAGLGGTLVLLSVYHHALPALPISIFLGVFFYFVTRVFIEPWVEAVMERPYYV